MKSMVARPAVGEGQEFSYAAGTTPGILDGFTDEENAACSFLLALFGNVTGAGGWLVVPIFATDRGGRAQKPIRVHLSTCKPLPTVARTVIEESRAGHNVYFNLGLQAQEPAGDYKRGDSAGVRVVPGLFLDLDIAKPGAPAGVAYPPDRAAALSLLDELGLEFAPSLVVDTGGGFHVHWLFDKPEILETDEDRERARRRSEAWQSRIRALAKPHGWTVDKTHDLARMARIPGTINHKWQRPVHLVLDRSAPMRRYAPSHFDIPAENRKASHMTRLFPAESERSQARAKRAEWGSRALEFLTHPEDVISGEQDNRGAETARYLLGPGGLDQASAEDKLWEAAQRLHVGAPSRPWNPTDVKRWLSQARKVTEKRAGESLAADDERSRIYAQDPELSKVVHQAWSAILKLNAQKPTLFRHGSRLVRLEAPPDNGGTLVLADLTPERFTMELSLAATWWEPRKEEDRQVQPPSHLVRVLLVDAASGSLPELSRIVRVPVFARSGALVSTRGYHAESGIYYEPAPALEVPRFAEAPSIADVNDATRLLFGEWLGGFPFVNDSAVAHALGLFLLPYVRDMIDGPTPLHLVEAPTPGTGKSLLVSCLMTPYVPSIAASSPPTTEDEWRKSITAQLKGGKTIYWVDNVNQRLDFASLSGAITSEVWSDRILGQSAEVRFPIRAVWVATGNNVSFSAELARRVVRIRLDAKSDRPEERQDFAIADLRGWTLARRGDLLAAAFVLVRNWLAKGRPPFSGKLLGSFESWSRVIGGILEAAGFTGFLDPEERERFRSSADAQGRAWRSLVTSWAERFGPRPVSARELYEALEVEEIALDLGLRGADAHARSSSFGKALSKRREQTIAGYQLLDAGQAGHVAMWRLETVAAP